MTASFNGMLYTDSALKSGVLAFVNQASELGPSKL
jgi:hypothetical protein